MRTNSQKQNTGPCGEPDKLYMCLTDGAAWLPRPSGAHARDVRPRRSVGISNGYHSCFRYFCSISTTIRDDDQQMSDAR